MKQAKLQKMDVLAGEVDSGVSDLNSLSLIQKLYQLSGEAKVCIENKRVHPCDFYIKLQNFSNGILTNPF